MWQYGVVGAYRLYALTDDSKPLDSHIAEVRFATSDSILYMYECVSCVVIGLFRLIRVHVVLNTILKTVNYLEMQSGWNVAASQELACRNRPLILWHNSLSLNAVRLGYCFTSYQRLWLYNGAPLVAFYDSLGIRRTYSRLKPPASSRGLNAVMLCLSHCAIERSGRINVGIYLWKVLKTLFVNVVGQDSRSHLQNHICTSGYRQMHVVKGDWNGVVSRNNHKIGGLVSVLGRGRKRALRNVYGVRARP